MVTEDRSRGQVILIGAIALAFIILGVVVVFNGVLYTETLSSGSTSQSANTAEVTEFEVEQGVGCLLREIPPEDLQTISEGESNIKSEINAFGELYRQSGAQSKPAVRNVSVADSDPIDFDLGDSINTVDILIEYDSQDLSYEETLTIEPAVEGEGCPEEES